MSATDELTNHSYIPDPQPEGAPTCSSDAGGARARKDHATSLLQRFQARRKAPVTTESARPAATGQLARTPWREDLPSPHCVLEDYREGARHYGGEAAIAVWAYWTVAFIPLCFNKVAAACHAVSQRPGRFWGTALIVIMFAVSLYALG